MLAVKAIHILCRNVLSFYFIFPIAKIDFKIAAKDKLSKLFLLKGAKRNSFSDCSSCRRVGEV